MIGLFLAVFSLLLASSLYGSSSDTSMSTDNKTNSLGSNAEAAGSSSSEPAPQGGIQDTQQQIRPVPPEVPPVVTRFVRPTHHAFLTAGPIFSSSDQYYSSTGSNSAQTYPTQTYPTQTFMGVAPRSENQSSVLRRVAFLNRSFV